MPICSLRRERIGLDPDGGEVMEKLRGIQRRKHNQNILHEIMYLFTIKEIHPIKKGHEPVKKESYIVYLFVSFFFVCFPFKENNKHKGIIKPPWDQHPDAALIMEN